MALANLPRSMRAQGMHEGSRVDEFEGTASFENLISPPKVEA